MGVTDLQVAVCFGLATWRLRMHPVLATLRKHARG